MMIPVLIVRDIPEAITFLTGVLDCLLDFATPAEAPAYTVLHRGAEELHLNLAHGDRQPGGASFIITCADVDALFASFIARGLMASTKAHSPVHQGPLDQTWGTREVYIDDPSGNTIRAVLASMMSSDVIQRESEPSAGQMDDQSSLLVVVETSGLDQQVTDRCATDDPVAAKPATAKRDLRRQY